MKNFQATEIRSLILKLTFLPIGWGSDPAIYSMESEFKGPKAKEEDIIYDKSNPNNISKAI